ncbi:MAG: isoprenylcysteine carboxylmethyltransferase family protein, partial [Candidatus Aminicenantes bacterium]|nr:isoprenylcysteine carboxylmethyltransferase family protein [Candidatus Aminicenantes bacterium]NIR06544.1 isoprenylcysteine carboxylmethyltransferase family protein [Candidatus Aminicenantes bacterium]
MLASLCLALILFVFAQPSSFSILLGLPFLLLGETIRIYSVGTIKKNVEVTQEGPYSITRNPLYLGNLFLVLGFSIISNEWILVVIYLGLFYFIYDATIKDE